jgi:uncharacterized protein (TIGR02449 family)
MSSSHATVLQETYDTLETRVNELVRVCTALKLENRNLRLQQKKLAAENAVLVERNQAAAERIEAIVGRLQSLEPSS